MGNSLNCNFSIVLFNPIFSIAFFIVVSVVSSLTKKVLEWNVIFTEYALIMAVVEFGAVVVMLTL